MRAAAQRALDATLAPDRALQTWFVGRSPCLHHPAPVGSGGGGGETLFFHRAQLIRGKPRLRAGSGLAEFVWATKAELEARLGDAELAAQLRRAL